MGSPGALSRCGVDSDFCSANGNFDLFDDDLRDDDRATNNSFADASDYIVDIREYDVPYHVRVMIDMGESASCGVVVSVG